MEKIDDKTIDLILADLPYGVTDNSWDVLIPFEKLWKEYNRIIKDHGCIALFGQEPFSSQLRMSNKKMYRYDWVWVTPEISNFLNAHKMPLRAHQDICIFYKKLPKYNPQMRTGFKPYRTKKTGSLSSNYRISAKAASNYKGSTSNGERFPIDVLKYSKNCSNRLHPTQKPVPLLTYLIKTYTTEGNLVLDNVMGSGSTGIAAVETNRNFIGIEQDENYFRIAKERIEAKTKGNSDE